MGQYDQATFFPATLSATRQIPAPCNSICCAWTTLPGCFPRTVSLCRWQKKRSSLLAALRHRKARLLFEVTNKGVLKVEPKIDGDDSKGIKEVSIFAFDLACVIIGSEGGYIPGFLIHDSHLFDAMDDRQLCSCLNIGARLSDEHGLQYIVLLNTDRLEAVELIGFDRANYPIETILTDKGDDSGLFGFRFN